MVFDVEMYEKPDGKVPVLEFIVVCKIILRKEKI